MPAVGSAEAPCGALEELLESQLEDRIAMWRLEKSLATTFDHQLSLILQPAIAAYELDRAVGVSFGNKDFQSAIKRYVRKGELFKAYPSCYCHVDATAIMQSLVQNGAQVALNHGRNVRLAVRCKIFPYTEGLFACWVMVAACYEKE